MFTERSPAFSVRRASVALRAVRVRLVSPVFDRGPHVAAATVPRPSRGRQRALRALPLAVVVIAAMAGSAAPSAAAGPPVVRATERSPVARADRAAIEATIREQLDAFGRDDAERAFGFATADIRRQFGSSDNFMRTVQEHYEPVYRATGVQFLGLARVDGQWVQAVQLVDGEGRVWRALFAMRRQADRSWKVGGCQLVQTSALAT